ncbi:hypothetical protein CO026_02635 [Candidatus Kaiserbacteria bacterium CG_4_9_14_0_2_um_filter_41_32]|uniref:Uncharacterized protein n=1 Tax=Candidatus Kaiserbacteria bacterium CG_4_9_14_0_2_um_filter_41_32 TaxID=1974601 RepID=A0A2M8FED8_9BACT|nr:MAG: hypothetical protein CO026_02635 [Candidatus Kaiserbacteria bacterium CG_4_9_14_0_2_um_filter_41_32]
MRKIISENEVTGNSSRGRNNFIKNIMVNSKTPTEWFEGGFFVLHIFILDIDIGFKPIKKPG